MANQINAYHSNMPPSPIASPVHSYTSQTERSFPSVVLQPKLTKSSSEESITDDMQRADRRSRSDPRLVRNSLVLPRSTASPSSPSPSPLPSPASSPGMIPSPTPSPTRISPQSPLVPLSASPGGPSVPLLSIPESSEASNWERAEKRTVSRQVINIAAHSAIPVPVSSVALQPANHAVLLPPITVTSHPIGLTRLGSAPISSAPPPAEREKKIARSISAHISAPRDEEHSAFYEIAKEVAAVLCEQYPTFDEEWKRNTPAQREATLEKIVLQIAAKRTPPTSPTGPASYPTPPASPTTQSTPPPLSLNSSGGVAFPAPPLPPKPRNKPDEKPGKEKKDKHDKHEKHEKHKKEKGPLRLITRANSNQNIISEVLAKSTSFAVHDESMAHLQEFARSGSADWIGNETAKKKRSKTVSRKKLVGTVEPEDSKGTTRHIGELASGLETCMSDFLRLINSSILKHEHTPLGSAPVRMSSISQASIESLATSISGMRDSLKEVLEIYVKILEEAMATEAQEKPEKSERKINKKKDRSPPSILELMHRTLTYTASLIEAIPLKGKNNEAMVAALAAVTVNFINTKLKMEDTLEENIIQECAGLRGCVMQLVLELRTNANMNAEEVSSQCILFQFTSAANVFVETMQRILDSIATLRYVMASDFTRTLTNLRTESASDDVNIWEDTTEILYSDGVFRAGNLNKLVETLTSTEQIDNKYLSTFITTYQSITSPAEFFGKLVQRYNIPASANLKDGVMKAIKVRVCIVLKYWIENQFRDFDQDMVAKLSDFIEKILPMDGNGEVAKQLGKVLHAKVNEVNARRSKMFIQSIVTLGLYNSPSQIFSVFSSFEIAKQLTLIEYTLFSKIHPAELLSQAWNSRTARQNSTHVLDLIQRTNRLSFWVGSLLLWQPTLQHRIKTLTKIISLGQELRNLNNFNTLMGIVAGLSMSAINRLKNTFKGLDSKQTEALEKLQAVLNPGMSFKCYRQELAAAKGPCLPYLGTILSDLTFMEDGNNNFITCPKSKKALVNYSKRELINNVILEIKLHQQVPFNIPRMDPLTSFLECLPCAEDKELYELSLLREPREVKTVR